MTWKSAQAKQNLSRLIRAASSEPQQIYNRNRLVAAVISGETLARFEAWQREQVSHRPLSEAFAELRALCAEKDYEFPEVRRADRPSPTGGIKVADPFKGQNTRSKAKTPAQRPGHLRTGGGGSPYMPMTHDRPPFQAEVLLASRQLLDSVPTRRHQEC